MIGGFIKAYFHRLIKISQSLIHERIQKCSIKTLKCFAIFSNAPPASSDAHITRDFHTCYYIVIGIILSCFDKLSTQAF